MNMSSLIPWNRHNGQAPSVRREYERNPFLSLHQEVNRVFDDAFRSFGRDLPTFGSLSAFGGGWPSVEVSETDKEIRVTAEVPGMEEKDIELVLDDGALVLHGEKRSETEDKDKRFSERVYGSFERRIPLASEIVEDEVEARFKNGVLSVTLPKSAKAQSQVKRITINA